jgi:hypothetical protein
MILYHHEVCLRRRGVFICGILHHLNLFSLLYTLFLILCNVLTYYHLSIENEILRH